MASYYPDELIEEVRINNDIVDVVSEYVRLERKAKYYFGLCPFHKEKTPSFSVSPDKQIFYCFGCGKGGNVFQFIVHAENLEYIEAVRFLAERARIQLPEGNDNAEKEKAQLRQEIIKINTEAARFFYANLELPQSEKSRQYLRDRGLSEKTIKRFGLGYSLEEWDSLHKYLLHKGFSENAVIKSGLILPNNKNGTYYDRFRGRIIFPIFDIRGNVIGFGGRVMDSSMPKYMNSPETPVYNKGRNLYALNFAKNSGTKKILIVEGYMDVISLHQNGIINTVASLGTALTENQGRLLKKYAEEIIISYDSDSAGQAATMKGLDLLNDIGCNVKVLTIPQGKDPDEFIKNNGTEKFRSLIDSAVTLIEYKIKVLKKQINTETTEGKISFLNKISDVLAKVDNSVEREMYIKKLAKEYEISQDAILSEVYKRIKPRTSFRETVVNLSEHSKMVNKSNENSSNEKLSHNEKMLLALLCIDNKVYKAVKGKISVESFTNPDNKQAASIVITRLESGKDIVSGELLGLLEKNVESEFARIIQEECNCEDNLKAVLDIIKGMELNRLDKRQHEILKLLKELEDKTERDVEKLKQDLKQELSSIILKRKNI